MNRLAIRTTGFTSNIFLRKPNPIHYGRTSGYLNVTKILAMDEDDAKDPDQYSAWIAMLEAATDVQDSHSSIINRRITASIQPSLVLPAFRQTQLAGPEHP